MTQAPEDRVVEAAGVLGSEFHYSHFEKAEAAATLLALAERIAQVVKAARGFWNTTDEYPIGINFATQSKAWDEFCESLSLLDQETDRQKEEA